MSKIKAGIVFNKVLSCAVTLARSTFGLLAEASADVGEWFLPRHSGRA
jgi:hypothetical protein